MYLNNLQLSQHDKRGLCGAGRSQPALEKGGGGDLTLFPQKLTTEIQFLQSGLES